MGSPARAGIDLTIPYNGVATFTDGSPARAGIDLDGSSGPYPVDSIEGSPARAGIDPCKSGESSGAIYAAVPPHARG